MWRAQSVAVSVVVLAFLSITRADVGTPGVNTGAPNGGVVQNITTTTTTTSTFTSETISSKPCPFVLQCLSMPMCRTCLEAINASTGSVRTDAQWLALSISELKSLENAVNRALLLNQSCTSLLIDGAINSAMALYYLQQALSALQWSDPAGDPETCSRRHGMVSNFCASRTLNTYMTCPGFLSGVAQPANNCLECLQDVFGFNDNVTKSRSAMRSRACMSTIVGDPSWFNNLPTGGFLNDCVSFPMCSTLKLQCIEDTTGCAACLETLERGDGAGAALQCSERANPISAGILDDVMDWCSAGTSVACSYWQQRCADNSDCTSCLEEMGNGDSAQAIVADYTTESCVIAAAGQIGYLDEIAHSCSNIGACRRAVSQCVFQYPTYKSCSCATCLASNASGSLPDCCQEVLQNYHFDVVCQPCPESVYTINTVVRLTAVVGGASSTLCRGGFAASTDSSALSC
jgi:hypothetical protein